MALPRQDFGPFSFDAPSDWSRRAMLLFVEPPRSSGTAAAITITRDQCARGEALQTYAWRRLFEIVQGEPARQLLDGRATKIGEQPAFKAVLGWTTEDGPMRELVAWVDGGEGNVLVMSCTTPEDGAVDTFEQLLASLRMGPPSSAKSTPIPSAPRSSPPPPPEVTDGYAAVPMPGARSARH
jgi:hypothetical protein